LDQLAGLIGYAVIGVVLVGVASYLLRAAPEFWKVAGWHGVVGLILGLGGFVWMAYAFANKDDVSSGGLLLGLVAFWGTEIFVIAAWARTQKGSNPERAPKRTARPPLNDVDRP